MIESLSEKETMSYNLNTCCSWRQKPGKEKNKFRQFSVFNNSKVNLQHLYIRSINLYIIFFANKIKHPKTKLKTNRLQYLFDEVKYNRVCGGIWGQKQSFIC